MDITRHDKILRFAYFALLASKLKRGFPRPYIVDGVFNIDLWLQKNKSGALNESLVTNLNSFLELYLIQTLSSFNTATFEQT